MTGRYRDGSIPVQDGQETSFMYNGNPANQDDYTLCSLDIVESGFNDRRSLMGIGPMRLPAGESTQFTFSFTAYPFSNMHCPDIDILVDELNNMQEVLKEEYLNTSTRPIVNSNQLAVYPNPVQDQFTIELKNTNDTIETIALYNVDGRLAKRLDGLGKSQQTIQVNELTNGMYFYQVTTQTKQLYNGKVIIQ